MSMRIDRTLITFRNTSLKKYRRALESWAAELKERLHLPSDITIQTAPDAADQRLLDAERETAIQNLDRRSRLLREIEAALTRLKSGQYGVCLRCEEEISPKRLDAVPWAAFCVRCQESVDRLQERLRAFQAGPVQAA
jgi:DnaK suppressor protein